MLTYNMYRYIIVIEYIVRDGLQAGRSEGAELGGEG